ncbi:hypothetical protein [Anaeromassilibacillus sp. D41t1_190614_C2]|uniref:hypothetical protein n=1 Tax=Anaeromassilibacillus sp. D41t1_190614_C2 TaxID=2787078 RepID=UPI002ED3DAB3
MPARKSCRCTSPPRAASSKSRIRSWRAKSSLQAAVDKADSLDLNDYTDNDAKAALPDALEAAKEVLADETASQEAVDEQTIALNDILMGLRRKADKSELNSILSKAQAVDTSEYTAASVATLKSAMNRALAIIDDKDMTEEDQPKVDRATRALASAYNALVPKSTSSSGSSSSGKGSTSANIGNAYGAAGVVSASQSVAANAYVVSDTTVNFMLKRGQAYCFKMTVVNGNAMTPGFTAGNGDVLKTQFVAKIGNDYYYRVYATGTPGQSTGVYTTLPGNTPVKHCAVTIG